MSTNTTMDRRKFLKVAGCGAVVALVGGGCSLATKAGATCPFGRTNDPYPGECSRYVDLNGNGICDLSEISTTTEQLATATPSSAVETTATTDTVQPAASSSQTICQRNCRYPGHCGRYTDTNGTGQCDLSEMTLAEAQAAGITVSTAGGPRS
jgi:hypothetical protein